MPFMRRHWYNVSLGIALMLAIVLFSARDALSTLQLLSLANLAVIFLHFFEEFGFPGGFGKLANTLLTTDSPAIDRYPLNQTAVWVGNWSFALLFYVPPIFFPSLIWLGLMPMLFGAIGQGLAHGVLNNVVLKRAGLRWGYNSGLATTILGHWPLAIAYGSVVSSQSLASGWDWLIGIAYAVFAYVVIFRSAIMGSLANRNSRHPFDATEIARFDKLYGRASTPA